MSKQVEVNTSECAFNTLNMCRSPINKYDIECEKVPIEKCYFKQLQQLKQENEELKKGWYNSTKCHHRVLDECSLTGKNCKGLQECFKQTEQKLEKIKEMIEMCICGNCWNCNNREFTNCTNLLKSDILHITKVRNE